MKTDQRPDPKPRKLAHLWQTYLMWDELVRLRTRHTNRIASITAGKSNLDAEIELNYLNETLLDEWIARKHEEMINFAQFDAGPIWQWLTGIKGLKAGGLAAQLLAQVDDISAFATVSKLWRFSGYAVIDGHREYNTVGEKAHYNRRLKSVCFLIADQFIRQQTELYSDIYYAEKARQRELHPIPETVASQNGSTNKQKYTDMHIHRMAMRKMIKIFLQHLWVQWRVSEGLSVSEPYVQAILHHAHIIEPEPVYA